MGAWRRDESRVHERFGLLLILLAGSFVALGFAQNTWARVLASILQTMALVVAVLTTRPGQDHRWLGLCGLWGAGVVLLEAATSDLSTGLGEIGAIVLLFVILLAVLHRVLHHSTVTLQTLYGAVCAYFLIGLMFGSLYAAMDAFGNQPIFGEPVSPSVYSYFSFVTMTTVGFGDYTVKTDLARRIVVIEAVLGQIFIATTLARLVSLYKSTPRPATGAGEPGAPPT